MVNEATPPGRCYGYVRVSTDRQALSPESQRRTIEEAARRIGQTIDAWFQDAPVKNPDGSFNDAQSGKVPLPERRAGKELCAWQDAPVKNPDGSFNDAQSGKVPLPERRAGKELCAWLKKGDVVIVAKVDRAFRRLSDCVIMLDRWERLGVGVVLCDFPMISDLANPFGKALIQIVAVFAEIERKLISQRTKEALALRKRRGQAHSRYPGYGRKWERRWDQEQGKFVKVKVADPEEREVMRAIVRWKREGQGWDAITLRLERQKILTRDGVPWSRSRVIRAYRAELKLQAPETRSTIE